MTNLEKILEEHFNGFLGNAFCDAFGGHCANCPLNKECTTTNGDGESLDEWLNSEYIETPEDKIARLEKTIAELEEKNKNLEKELSNRNIRPNY